MRQKYMLIFAMCLVVGLFMFMSIPCSSSAASREKILLKGGSPWGESHRNSQGLIYFGNTVQKLSKGDITIQKFLGGSIVKGKTQIDAIKNNVVDISSVTPPYHPGVISGFARVITMMPFVSDFSSWQWLYTNTKWFTQYLLDLKLKPMYASLGELVIALNKPLDDIKNPSLQGRKIRAPGLGFKEFVNALGADTVTMPSGEVPAALATGLCSGLFTTLDTWETLGLADVCPNVYILNSPYATLDVMGEKRYSKLPKWAQKIVTQAGEDTTKHQIALAFNYREKLINKYKGSPKVKIYVLTKEQTDGWKTKLNGFFKWTKKEFDPQMSKFLADCEKAWNKTHSK